MLLWEVLNRVARQWSISTYQSLCLWKDYMSRRFSFGNEFVSALVMKQIKHKQTKKVLLIRFLNSISCPRHNMQETDDCKIVTDDTAAYPNCCPALVCEKTEKRNTRTCSSYYREKTKIEVCFTEWRGNLDIYIYIYIYIFKLWWLIKQQGTAMQTITCLEIFW